MKNLTKFLVSTAVFTYVFSFTNYVYAVSVNTCPSGEFAGLCLSADNLGSAIQSFITILLIIAIILSIIFIIWGGIKWITARGDKAAIESARGTIIAAIIGLIITLSSFFIYFTVITILGITPSSTFTIPKIFN